ncbi:unnamed protein product, partial [Linum tenue]
CTDENGAEKPESILNIRYGISGARTSGAHPPVAMEYSGSDSARKDLTFRSVLVLQRPGEVLYEVNANPENWMIAGRKRGYIPLSKKQGSRIVISVLCVPLVAGYVRPPQLGLPNVDESDISCNPPGPHLVCIMPPALSSSFCIPV